MELGLCRCGIAPMVTDDATFHGLSLQLHPQFGLGNLDIEQLYQRIHAVPSNEADS